MPDLTSVPGASGPALDAPFRSRRGRTMALTMAGVSLALFALLAIFVHGWAVGDRLLMFGLGAVMALFLHRYAAIVAVPRPEGLYVRNLFLTRTVPWDEILGVRFPEGDAWAHLDLAEGDTLAVMAVQRADAQGAQTEAQRLAELVASRQAA